MNLKFLAVILVLDIMALIGGISLLWNRIEAAWNAPSQSLPAQNMSYQTKSHEPVPSDLSRTPSQPVPEEKKETAEPKEEFGAEESMSEPPHVSKPMKSKKVTFAYSDSAAKRVTLVGDFNQWSPQLLQKQNESMWTIRMDLKPGKYAYNFIVDGEMIPDPKNKRSKNLGQKVPSSLLTIKSK